jgi:integrase
LDDPESIEVALASHDLPISIKWHMVNVYRSYCKTFNVVWEPVRIKYQPKMPYMPTETEAKTFISALPKTLMVLCRTLFETGCRIGEAVKIEWTDINQETCTIAISHPEKGSNPRVNKVSRELIELLISMPKKHGDHVFNPKPRALDGSFQRARAKLAAKWQQPNINKIHFHTFRHLRGTLDVHNHVPLFEVKSRLGHRFIGNTEKYIHWNQQLYQEKNDRYIFAAASTIEQVEPLIENGFEYVCDLQGMKLFRKPK